MTDAVAAYEEKARDLWLFDYPAQVSLCGTQIWWTTEVFLKLQAILILTLTGLFIEMLFKQAFNFPL